MFSKLLVLVAAASLAVNAQDLSSITPCVLACIQPAAAQNNCAFTDASCVCISAQFQADATACLTEHCTPEDLQAAVALQQAQCTAANLSATDTATPNPVSFTAPAASATGTDTTTAATGTTPAAPSTTAPSASTSPSTPAPSNAALSLTSQNGLGALAAVMVAGLAAL